MLANIGMVQLLIVLVMVILIFGSKRIKDLGHDVGAMISGFRKETKDIDTQEVLKEVNSARKTIKTAKKFVGK